MSNLLQEQELFQESRENRLDEMRRIIASQSFAKAPRLCSFLTYIVEKSVDGDVESLTEQQIGIYVFHRSPGYNSNDDNIVRGTARTLRQRLAAYYQTEGAHDPIHIEIPKGAYVALFLDAASAHALTSADLMATGLGASHFSDVPAAPSQPLVWAWAVLACACAMALIAWWPTLHARVARSQDKSTLLWNTLFTPDKTTFLVPGDAGLNMYETLESRAVDLDAYTSQTYRQNPAPPTSPADVLGGRYYTTMSDLQLVTTLVRLPEADPSRLQVRFARDLTAHDLKDANLILMGTSSYNPWTELFRPSLSLQLSWNPQEDLFTVVNRTPQSGELPLYQWSVKNGTQGGLTLISLTDSTQGNGRVLLIEGTTMGGMYAAADFLANKQLFDPILARAQLPGGKLRNFDILLQSDFIREGVSNLHVLVAHVR